MAIDDAPQRAKRRRQVSDEWYATIGALVGERAVAEGAGAQAGVQQLLEVDVGGDQLWLAREALRFGQAVAALVDQRMGVEGQVGRGFARPGGGVDIRCLGRCRGLPAQVVACLRLAEQEVAARKIAAHGGAGTRLERIWRELDPGVLADLDAHDQPGHVLCGKEEVEPERHDLPQQLDRHAIGDGAPFTKLPLLVELTVVGQVGLGDDSQEPPALKAGRDVEDAGMHVKRQAHEGERAEIAPLALLE